MSEKRLYSYDKGNNKILCDLDDVCDFNVSNVFKLLNSLANENEQLKKQNIEYEEVQCKIMNYIIDKGLGPEFAKFLRENM